MLCKNFIGHLKTVMQHRHQVFIHCVKAGIPMRGLPHDLSKFSPTEFIPGVLYYQGNRSPNEREREVGGYSRAWMHHKGRNRHHFEYWIDYCLDPDGKAYMGGCRMPMKYVAEQFCDRIAACRVYLGEGYTDAAPYDYFSSSS